MKIESVSIRNFKLFENFELSFENKTLGEVNDLFLILGDNGTGKTTLLQAIALPLAFVTRSIRSVSDFEWMGFLPARYWKWGTPEIRMVILFADDEIEATQEVAKIWYEKMPEEFTREHGFIKPGSSRAVTLSLNGEYWSAGSIEERLQFSGRYYARNLLRSDSSVRSRFSKLPGIFWFDQYRNLFRNSAQRTASEDDGKNSFSGIGGLREYLVRWKSAQIAGRAIRNDYLEQLEGYYKRIFPKRSFSGLEKSPSIESPSEDETFFVLNDGKHTYDIAEMSAGEQGILPILYEVVRQQIAYSIVLIDEVDLNLHPPIAQFFVSQLPKIAPTCQFIITTHSEAVNDIIGEDQTYRLQGGRLCL